MENYFYIFAIPLVFYLFLFLQYILQKEWIANKYALGSIKVIILVPFWVSYLYFIIPFSFPYLQNLINPTDSQQEIIIENNENVAQKFFLIGRKFRSNEWLAVYNQEKWSLNKTPIYKIEPNDLKIIKARSGVEDFDVIAISKLTGFSYSKDKFIGLAFNVPAVPIKVYANEFQNPRKFQKVKVNTKKEMLLLIISLIAFLGAIYHLLLIKGKLIFKILIGIILVLILTISSYLVSQLSITLWYLHF